MNLTKLIPLVAAAMLATATVSPAALIGPGDVTSSLDGDLFFDDARTGGGDQTINEGSLANVQRFFDYDGNGLIAAPGVPGLVTIQGFGFATGAAAAANDATLIDLTFIYLGADENPNTPDDVLIGTERVGYSFSGAGEYFVNLDSDPSALIDGLGSRFRIQIAPVDDNAGLIESIRFKTRPANEQAFGHQGPTLSLSGTYAAIPEPTAMLAFGVPAVALLLTRRRRRSTAG